MAEVTPCRSYPYPEDTDPVDVAADIKALAEKLDADLCNILSDFERIPVGTLRETINSVADPGWLMMGTTVVNGQSQYPALWDMAPSSWKLGADLVLPDMTNRVLSGVGTLSIGQLGGSNTRTITANNLPLHTHTLNHDHPAVNSGTVSADHAHSFTTGGFSTNHFHLAPDYGQIIRYNPFSGQHLNVTATGNWPAEIVATANAYNTGYANTDHSHSGSTGGINTNHTHAVDVPNFAGSSGNGAFPNTPIDVSQASMAVYHQIKAV